MNKRNGITLIALVITVIALLILAGAAVSIGLNGDSVFSKANEAKTEWNEKVAEENKTSNSYLRYLKEYLGAEDIEISFEVNGDNYLTKEQVIASKIPSGFYYVGGDINTGLVISDAATDTNRYATASTVGVDLDGNQFVWVPVKQNQKISLSVSSDEDITSIKLYNPFGEQINLGISGNIGTSYSNNNINPTINGRYLVLAETADSKILKDFWVNTLYAKDTFGDTRNSNQYLYLTEDYNLNNIRNLISEDGIFNYNGYDNLADFLEQQGYNSLEEALGTTYNNIYDYFGYTDYDTYTDYILENVANIARAHDYYDEWDNEQWGIVAHTTSVNNNGGFYIGRYEAGKSSGGTAVCKVDQEPYNNITSNDASNTLVKQINTNCVLPTGAVYDRLMRWLIESDNNLSLNDVAEDSRSWGSYLNSQFEANRGKYSEVTHQTNGDHGQIETFEEVNGNYLKPQNAEIILTTGASTNRNVSNNIFDLAGNIEEMTTEGDTDASMSRGGSYVDDGYQGTGNADPNGYCATAAAARHYYMYYNSLNDLGFRPALFLP